MNPNTPALHRDPDLASERIRAPSRKARPSSAGRCSVEHVRWWSRDEIGQGITLMTGSRRWARNQQAAGKNALTFGHPSPADPQAGLAQKEPQHRFLAGADVSGEIHALAQGTAAAGGGQQRSAAGAQGHLIASQGC